MSGVSDFILDGLRRWADQTPEVKRLWLFGSRARGTHRLDSDIDVAVELYGWDSDVEKDRVRANGDWVCLAPRWREQVRPITSLPIDLRPTFRDDGCVPEALKLGSELIYERRV